MCFSSFRLCGAAHAERYSIVFRAATRNVVGPNVRVEHQRATRPIVLYIAYIYMWKDEVVDGPTDNYGEVCFDGGGNGAEKYLLGNGAVLVG